MSYNPQIATVFTLANSDPMAVAMVDGNGDQIPTPLPVTIVSSGLLSISGLDLDIRDLVFASDKVDVSGSTIAIGASVLPTGASTAANQATEIAALASIDAGIPAALGQAAMAASMPVVFASDQSPLSVEDIIPTIQLTGQYLGKIAHVFNLMGQRNGFTSITVHNAIKEYDNAVADIADTNNSTLDIISSSVNDAAAGTGVRTVKVTYINNLNNLVESAAITLNGTTLVTSVLTGVNQVLWMESATVGSVGSAVGNIRLRINGGTVEVEQISIGNNKSRSAVFMIPTGYTGYLVNWNASAINNDQATVVVAQVNTLDRTFSTVYHAQSTKYAALNTNVIAVPDLWLKLPALARIKALTVSGGTAAAVRCNVNIKIVLIEN